MEERVKKTAVLILAHSAENIAILHKTMEAELGDAYTPDDRLMLEEAVARSHAALLEEIESM